MVGPKVSALDTKITILYIGYNMTVAAILIFDKCIYLRGRLRLTTARRLLFTLGHFTCLFEQIYDDDDDDDFLDYSFAQRFAES